MKYLWKDIILVLVVLCVAVALIVCAGGYALYSVMEIFWGSV